MTESTTPWLQFLAQHGARIDADGQLTGFPAELTTAALADGFVAPLTDLGVIAASGADAATFLHNQLTNDVENLAAGQARLAGYCSPKGRLLASFLVWRDETAIYLQLPREIQPAIQKRLQMFVLRAKVTLRDATADIVTLGLGGKGAAAALGAWFPALPAAPYASVSSAAGTLIRLADAYGHPRYQWITDAAQASAAWPALATTLQAATPRAWHLADIDAGIPQITAPTQEQFVPQMINYEVVGGVNFRKGCYPGQEIVARSQYLGKLKRRMHAAIVDGDAVNAGMEVFSENDPGQPCGMVVNAERQPQGGYACLVELKSAALDADAIRLGSAAGALLQLRALPYAMPDAAS